MATTSLVKALLDHCRIAGESMSDFRAQYARLTDEDKGWFKAQFKAEFGYEFAE